MFTLVVELFELSTPQDVKNIIKIRAKLRISYLKKRAAKESYIRTTIVVDFFIVKVEPFPI